jgi:hypothetical protein
MRNSYIFYKSGSKFQFQLFDCCEHLGDFLKEHKGKELIVGIPKGDINEFFNKIDNLLVYFDLLSVLFDMKYELASSEDIESCVMNSCPETNKDNLLFIKITIDKPFTNKYFVASYTCFRYLWYQQYTHIAILATNLYKLKLFEDPMDILAIASSYQPSYDRTLLPAVTIELPGLLYFRKKEDVWEELQHNTLFNNIFYKYPVYFDPIVKIKGSFFSESESVLKAKEIFNKLSSSIEIEDVPPYMLNNLKAIEEDYTLMKKSYLLIISELSKNKYLIRSDNPVLLSKESNLVSIRVTDPTGQYKTVKIQLYEHSSIKEKEEEKVELPF